MEGPGATDASSPTTARELAAAATRDSQREEQEEGAHGPRKSGRIEIRVGASPTWGLEALVRLLILKELPFPKWVIEGPRQRGKHRAKPGGGSQQLNRSGKEDQAPQSCCRAEKKDVEGAPRRRKRSRKEVKKSRKKEIKLLQGRKEECRSRKRRETRRSKQKAPRGAPR